MSPAVNINTAAIVPPELNQALDAAGLRWADLRAAASEVVLFGSRASGCAAQRSDWDLLCVGTGRPRLTRAVDVIWLPADAVRSPAWLESELAGHIGTYGQWLHGAPSWSPRLPEGESAASQAKAQRILRRVASLEPAWPHMSPPYQRKHRRRLCRDLQRHALLLRGEAIPPSAWLDAAWLEVPEPRATLARLFRGAGGCSRFFEEVLVHQHHE